MNRVLQTRVSTPNRLVSNGATQGRWRHSRRLVRSLIEALYQATLKMVAQ